VVDSVELGRSVFWTYKREKGESDEKDGREHRFCTHTQNEYPSFISINIAPHCLKYIGGDEMRKLVICLLIALMGVCASTSLGTTVYTNEASFTAQLQPGYYQEGFDYAPWTSLNYVPDPSPFTGGSGWNYNLSSVNPNVGLQGVLNPGGVAGGGAVRTQYNVEASLNDKGGTIQIDFTGTLPMAVGGIFWATNIRGIAVSGENVTLTLVSGGTFTYNDDSNWPAFTGFISDSPIASMSIYVADFATMDNFIVGTVPEPATMCLLGLGALGLLRKRRA
jgi:hypothetical protein